jgi:hypothetical protein
MVYCFKKIQKKSQANKKEQIKYNFIWTFPLHPFSRNVLLKLAGDVD